MNKKSYYEVKDKFYNETFNGKTYGRITNNIIADLMLLKKDYPELTGISKDAMYNLVKGVEVFGVTFQYDNEKTNRIDWSVEISEYKKPKPLPEGKTPLSLDMMPKYAFIGKIGEILVLVNFNIKNDKLRNSIINILKKNGAEEKDINLLVYH
jgi:hypothetical protein